MITIVETPIIDPLKQDSPAVLVIYGNTSNQTVDFIATMDDSGVVTQMGFKLPPKTKSSWIWRPINDEFTFDVVEIR